MILNDINKSKTLVVDALPFEGSKLYYYSFLYKKEKEFIQVQFLKIVNKDNSSSCIWFCTILKTKHNKNYTKLRNFLISCFTQSVFFILRHSSTIIALVVSIHLSSIKPAKANPIPYQITMVAGSKNLRIRAVSMEPSNFNRRGSPLARRLRSLGVNYTTFLERIQRLGSICINPNKIVRNPPNLLLAFYTSTDRLETSPIDRPFIDDLKRFLFQTFERKYSTFRRLQDVVENGNMIISAQEIKDYHVLMATMFQIVDPTVSIPQLEETFSTINQGLQDFSAGQITEAQAEQIEQEAKVVFDGLTSEDCPLFEHFSNDEKQLFPFVYFMKRAALGYYPVTFFRGQFFQLQDAHLVAARFFGLRLSATMVTISDHLHGLGTTIEKIATPHTAPVAGGANITKAQMTADSALKEIMSEHVLVGMELVHEAYLKTVIDTVRSFNINQLGSPEKILGLVDYSMNLPVLHEPLVELNCENIRQMMSIWGQHYGGPAAVYVWNLENPSGTVEEITQQFAAGTLYGQAVYPELVVNAYREHVNQLRSQS